MRPARGAVRAPAADAHESSQPREAVLPGVVAATDGQPVAGVDVAAVAGGVDGQVRGGGVPAAVDQADVLGTAVVRAYGDPTAAAENRAGAGRVGVQIRVAVPRIHGGRERASARDADAIHVPRVFGVVDDARSWRAPRPVKTAGSGRSKNVPSTRGRSSLGSSGSSGGASAAIAPGMLTSPQPVSGSQP